MVIPNRIIYLLTSVDHSSNFFIINVQNNIRPKHFIIYKINPDIYTVKFPPPAYLKSLLIRKYADERITAKSGGIDK